MVQDIPVTRRPLFHWVRRSSPRLQLALLAVILLTVAARVFPLEMQKKIVNEAINLRSMDLLIAYCGLYLAAVLVAGALKYLIGYLQTLLGEQCLAALRKDLYHHILALPVAAFRRIPAGTVVNALITELSPAGDFVGMAVAVTLTNALTLAAFAVYMFWLNPLLAGISLVIYPAVLIVVPWLQRRANDANKQRVDRTRDLSSKIGEAVSGIHEIHGSGSFAIEYRKFDALTDQLKAIRVRWNLLRSGAKSFNNLFVSLGPFLIFLMGGYLSITGRLDLGALVAFLSAQEKLYDPWKELIDFYQLYQDASIRYTRTLNFFDGRPEHALAPASGGAVVLEPAVEARNLSFTVEGGIRLLSDVSFRLQSGQRLALVGFSGSGKSTLAMCAAQLYRYTGGQLTLGGREVAELSKLDIAANVGFVSQSPFIFDGTIKENLLYACDALRAQGVAAPNPGRDDQIEALQQTGLFVDVLRFGLSAGLDAESRPELAARLLAVRSRFKAEHGAELADNVEFFDEQAFLRHSSVAANIIFGAPRRPEFSPERLAENPTFRADFLAFLEERGLIGPLVRLGADLAAATLDILGDLPPDAVFFEQSPIAADNLEAYRDITARRLGGQQATDADRDALVALALRFVPGLHRLAALPPELERMLLDARPAFRAGFSRNWPQAFAYYCPSEYIPARSILDNILFGRLTSDSPRAQEAIGQAINSLLIEEDLLEAVVELGMDFQVGAKGDKLSGGQRQKLAIARVLLKEPRLLILDEATSALDNRSQGRIQNLLDGMLRGRCTVIAVAHRLDTIRTFDIIAVMKAGKIVEMGGYDELMARKGVLYELVGGRRAG